MLLETFFSAKLEVQ